MVVNVGDVKMYSMNPPVKYYMDFIFDTTISSSDILDSVKLQIKNKETKETSFVDFYFTEDWMFEAVVDGYVYTGCLVDYLDCSYEHTGLCTSKIKKNGQYDRCPKTLNAKVFRCLVKLFGRVPFSNDFDGFIVDHDWYVKYYNTVS